MAEKNRTHVRALMDALRTRLASDVQRFAEAFPERKISVDDQAGPDVTIRRGHYPEVRLTIEPNLDAGTITINYVFASRAGVEAPKPAILELSGQDGGPAHFRDHTAQHAFRTIAQLSEYLLIPVFSGRPR
jgi:hypothetical protein